MKKYILSFLFLSATCFAAVTNTSQWRPAVSSNRNWGSGGTIENWTNGIPGVAGTTDYTAAFVFGSGNGDFPLVSGDITLRNITFDGRDGTIAFDTSGDTTISFITDTSLNQIEFEGTVTIQSAFVSATGSTVKIKDGGSGWLTGTSRLTNGDPKRTTTDTNLDILQGQGMFAVQSYTVLSYNPTSSDTSFPNNYQFSGTVDLGESYATWAITNARGPFVGQITGTESTGLVRLESNLTLHNSHTFAGVTEIVGKTLTLGTSGGNLPNSTLVFSGTSPSLVLNDDVTVSGILENISTPTTPTIALGSNTLTIDQSRNSVNLMDHIVADNDFAGVISGSGGIIKTGNKTLKLSGINEYTGATHVDAGKLIVSGSISSSSLLTIGESGSVSGTGTNPATTNHGTLTPGSSVGTLNINGNYIQSASGNLVVEVSSAPVASKLNITGTATLDGTVTIVLQKGIYPEGTTVTFLNASQGRSGQFATVVDSLSTDFVVQYAGNLVKLTVPENPSPTPVPVIVTHIATEAIRDKNAYSVANYLLNYPTNSTFNSEIVTQVNKIISHDFTEAEYLNALVAVSPLPVAAINRVHAQNIERVARSVDEMFISQAAYRNKFGTSAVFDYTASKPQGMEGPAEPKMESNRRKYKIREVKFGSSYGQYETSVFVEPYAIFYDQGRLQGDLVNVGQVPFQEFTFGLGGGYEMVFDTNYVFEIGGGYSYTNLEWRENFGKAHWNSLFIAPFLGWFSQNSFINGMLLGGFNFTHVLRLVPVQGISVRATSDFVCYDALVRLNGGHRFAIRRAEQSTDWLQGEATLNYLNIFTPSYTEKGAGVLNLKYKDKALLIMQPQAVVKWIHEIVYANAIIAPVLKAGWMGTFPLNKNKLKTKLALSPTSQFFDIQGYKIINQMVVGGELYYKSPRNYKVTSGFDTYFFDKTAIFNGSVKLEWIF